MRLGHTLVQDVSASAADQVLQAVAEHAVLFEGHQSFTMLPAHADVRAAAVLTLFHWKLLHHRQLLHFHFCKHTIAEVRAESQ